MNTTILDNVTHNATVTTTPIIIAEGTMKLPKFEVFFAIAGLLAVAYLVVIWQHKRK